MVTYLLQLTLCWTLFYIAYHFLLSGETHFRCNRWYLLIALGLGMVLPLISWESIFLHQPESFGHLYIAPLNTQLAEWEGAISATAPESMNWYSLMWVVYGIGALTTALHLLRSWWRILRIRRQSEQHACAGYTLVLTPQPLMPFSFLSSIYMSRDFYRDSPDVDKILAHELFHVQARHSIDVVVLEVLKVVFWFHPVVYVYKHELQQVHEYQADDAACRLSTKKQYGRLLLKHVSSSMASPLANPFFNSQLKNRFIMMTKKPSTRHSILKYLIMIPLVGLAILLFSYTDQGKAMLSAPLLQQDTLMPPPPPAPPLPGIGEEIMLGEDKYVVSTSDLLYVDGQRIGTLTDELIDTYAANGPWVFEVFTPEAAKARIDPGIDGYVYSIRKRAPGLDQVNKTYNPAGRQEGEIFRVVEEMPRFPGCEGMEGTSREIKSCADRKMLEFLYSNIRYPAIARDNGVEGNVVLSFIVEKDGSISNPKVIRDPGAGLGDEALRIVDMMAELPQKWTPGVQRGRNVRVQFILPVKFQLKSTKEEGSKSGRPLFVLDDEVLGTVDMEELNESIKPEDIESVNVLKGESAIKKYGEKGRDGVVEITTKWRHANTSVQLKVANIRIYPVPAQDLLNVEGVVTQDGAYELEVRDLKGSAVRSHAINVQDGMIKTQLNVNGLATGPYVLMIVHNGKVFSKAFVKQ